MSSRVFVLFLLTSLCFGCQAHLGDKSSDGSDDSSLPNAVPTETDPCTTAEQSFERELYVPVFSKCIGCHNEFGMARSMGTPFQMKFPGSADFRSHNTSVVSDLAKQEASEGLSLLLAKPTGQTGHVGGTVIEPESPEAQLLQSFIDKVLDPPSCEAPEDSVDAVLATLSARSPRENYARAHRLLRGIPAEPDDVWAMSNDEAGLSKAIDGILASSEFRKRLSSFYADSFLNLANGTINPGGDILFQSGWKSFRYYFSKCEEDARNTNICCKADREACCEDEQPLAYCEERKPLAQDLVTYEPLAMVEILTESEEPIAKLLTSDQVPLNPITTGVFGMTPDQRAALFDEDPSNDADEWVLGQIPATERNRLPSGPNGEEHYPHVGIVASTALLGRYYSTRSNLHRSRSARLIYEHLLDIDVQHFADFSTNVLPADADLELATNEYAACLSCHAAIDPVAAHFKNHWYYGFYQPDKAKRMPDHFPAAAFRGEEAPQSGNPVAWLAERVAGHERFRLAMTRPVVEALIGDSLLRPPQRGDDPEYRAKWLAYRLQQRLLRDIVTSLPDSSTLTFKDIVRGVLASPFFTTSGSSASGDQLLAIEMAALGGGKQVTPELASSHLNHLTHGEVLDWVGKSDGISSKRGFRFMLGGVDWREAEARYRRANPVSIRTLDLISNEMAWRAVVNDLSWSNPEDRRMFRHVDVDTTPSSDRAAFVADLRRLVLILWSKDVADDSPMIEELLSIWSEIHAISSSDNSDNVRYKGEVGDRVVDSDPKGSIEAWAGTLAVMMSAPDFILE